MTAYAVERAAFIVAMQAEGMAPEIARRILRHANTVQRLAVDSCNGVRSPRHYNQSDNALTACGLDIVAEDDIMWTHQWLRTTCPDCLSTRAERLIREWCGKCQHTRAIDRIVPIFQGDPRGCCVKLRVPSGRTDDMEREGMCIPTRRRRRY